MGWGALVEATRAEGAQVLAVARHAEGLARLEAEVPGVQTLALDASIEAKSVTPRHAEEASPATSGACRSELERLPLARAALGSHCRGSGRHRLHHREEAA